MIILQSLFMRIGNAKVLRQSGIYTLGYIASAAVPFALMPVLTRYLSPEDYGITAMLGVLVGVYTPFMGLNLRGLIGPAFFKNAKDFPKIVQSSFAILLMTMLVMSVFTYLLADSISDWTSFPSSWLWTVILLCVTDFFIQIVQTIQQMKGKAMQFAGLQFSQTIMNMMLSVGLVVLLSMNWQGRVMAQVIASLVIMGVSLFLLHRWRLLGVCFNWEYIKRGLIFGIPMIPHALSAWFIIASDRLLINNMVSLTELGVFSVGYSMGHAMELLASSFNKAYSPWLYRHLKNIADNKYDNRRKIVIISYLVIAGFIVFAVIYSCCMPWLLSFFVGPKFQAASQYVLGFAVGAAIHVGYYIMVNYIVYNGKTQYLAFGTCTSGVLHIGITYLMIRTFGAVGASYASIVTNTFMFVFTWWLANKVTPMPWQVWKRDENRMGS